MKKLYVIFSFVIANSIANAQNSNTKQADKLFDQFEYVSAAKEYQKIVEEGKSDNYVVKRLAVTYYNMFNSKEAVKWYEKLVQTQQDPETYYQYYQMLKANGNYAAANEQMQKFVSLVPNDQRAIAFKENPNYIPRLLDQQKSFEVKLSQINSDKSDFGAVLNGETVYFTSARNSASKQYGWNEEPYLDVYQARFNLDHTISDISLFKEINSKFHDGPVSITADGKTLYFASNSFRVSSFEKDKKKNLKIGRNSLFKASWLGDKWGNITSLPFNSTTYSTSNPSISADGKTLYFSSDMPGSYGSVDIWKVEVNSNGTYGKPVNLGKNVNTEGKETFPFIREDNNILYFASSGRQGFGGLDVFQADLSKDSAATNLGAPVNTEKDDFALTYNKNKNIGFLSSNRSGTDKIYMASPVCALDVLVTVRNATTKELLQNANVAIVDSTSNVISTKISDQNGEVSYKADCNKLFTVQVSREGFASNTFNVTDKTGETTVEADLEPIATIITDKEVLLKPIYFEFDKSNITQSAAFELDKLVQVMMLNTEMIIQVKSHTDTKGSEQYNDLLSEKRAKSTVQYLISKGIPQSRVSGKGLGESEPKIDCQDNCTEEQDTINRRSEFIIVK